MARVEHRGGHDWLSPEYVGRWVSDWSARDERPGQLRQVAVGLPFGRAADIRVLDVGSGWGPLAEAVLAYGPGASVTLVDISPPMLEHARSRLGVYSGRATYQQRDFAHAAWADGLDGPFDAAVAGLAVHNLGDPTLITRVYADVRGLLRPGGCFLNLELVFAAGPRVGAVDRRLRADEHGTDPDAATAGERPTSGRLSLGNQLAWLGAAGFTEVDCLWRDGDMALLCGVA